MEIDREWLKDQFTIGDTEAHFKKWGIVCCDEIEYTHIGVPEGFEVKYLRDSKTLQIAIIPKRAPA